MVFCKMPPHEMVCDIELLKIGTFGRPLFVMAVNLIHVINLMADWKWTSVTPALNEFVSHHGGYFVFYSFFTWGYMDILYGFVFPTDYCKSVSLLSAYTMAPFLTPKLVIFAQRNGLLKMEIDFRSWTRFRETFLQRKRFVVFIIAPVLFFCFKVLLIKVLYIEYFMYLLSLAMDNSTGFQLLTLAVSFGCDYFQIQLCTTYMMYANRLDVFLPLGKFLAMHISREDIVDLRRCSPYLKFNEPLLVTA